MIRVMNKDHLILLFQMLSETFYEKQDELCQLDADLGDGDLGLTMNKAMNEAYRYIQSTEEEDIGVIVSSVGLQISEVVASTMGTLLASGFRKAGHFLKGKHEITIADFVGAFDAFNEGIQNRGKAKLGDKTILDVLIPAQQFMSEIAEQELLAFPNKLLEHAEQSLTIATQLQSQKGRAARYLDKTIGKEDAGTKAAFHGINALTRFLIQLNEEVK